jgi:subtilisin
VELANGFRFFGVTDKAGKARFSDIPDLGHPLTVLAAPIGLGCWRAVRRVSGSTIEIDCPIISDTGPLGWWHEAIGVRSVNAWCGKGLRIGIADRGFKPGPGLEGLEVISLPGVPYSEQEEISHGELVARLIGNRSTRQNLFLGIAPGAEMVFVPLRSGSENVGVLLRDLSPAIFQLVKGGVDIVNLSLGHRQDFAEIRNIVARARLSGIICIAAAGNEGINSVSFPARYPICVSVGAVGMIGLAPPGSKVKADEEARRDPARGSEPGKRYFFPLECNYATKIDVVAPGVGIAVSTPTIDRFEMSGTSFAAPIAAGALAVGLFEDRRFLSLPRNQNRCDYMWGRLREMAQDLGMSAEFQGCGLVHV